MEESGFKTIKINKELWLKLNYLKLNDGKKTINDVIEQLIENKEKEQK
jgi:predicted CopG family antitoxin